MSDPSLIDTSALDSSGLTIRSDSENYSHSSPQSTHNDPSSPPSSSTPLILYSPPTLWGLLRGAAINLLLPFVNGLMLGFGELVANEAAYRLGWSGTKVRLHSWKDTGHIYELCSRDESTMSFGQEVY
jgi:hypothetical protein